MAFDYKKIILLIGIALIPFYEILIRLFPDATIITLDTRVAKSSLALLFALVIGLVALYQGVNFKVSNKWLLALLAFIPISINKATDITLVVNNVDSSSFWVWKPFAYILCYFLMYLGVSSLDLTKKVKKQIISVLYYTALAMTFYMFFQWLGIEQFYAVKDIEIRGSVDLPHVIGNLGQPTLAAPFLGLGIICAFGLRKWIPAIFMALFLFILGSKMATGATCVAVAVYLVLSRPRTLPYMIVIGLICATCLGMNFKTSDMSGRYKVYKDTIHDFKTSPIKDEAFVSPSYTGMGLGSYGYLFPMKHETKFKQAHSDPLEILYTLGLIGFILYILSLCDCFRNSYKIVKNGNNTIIPFICAFLLLQLVSCGTFIFQLGVYQYLGVMLFAILSNQSLIGREVK